MGTDHDTAAFAVETIRRWWRSTGVTCYPHASRLLITADGGGSNGYRTRLWKTELAALAADTGLQITATIGIRNGTTPSTHPETERVDHRQALRDPR